MQYNYFIFGRLLFANCLGTVCSLISKFNAQISSEFGKWSIAILLIFFSFLNTLYAEQIITDTEQILQADHNDYEKAEIIILNKITAKSETRVIAIGVVSPVGDLSLTLNRCAKWNHRNISEYLAHFTITSQAADKSVLFNGWLFSNNLSINSFQNSVFEVIMVQCIDNKSQEV